MARMAVAALALPLTPFWTGVSVGQGLGPPQPIPPQFAKFLQDEFNSVPPASVAERIPSSTCRKQQLPRVDGAASAQLYLCAVDVGCNVVQQVPVFVSPDGTLGFAPDTPEEVVFYACPASISDPVRRAEITRKLKLPAPKFTKIK